VGRRTTYPGAAADTVWLQVRTSQGAELALLRRIQTNDSVKITLEEASLGADKRLGVYAHSTFLARSGLVRRPPYINTVSTDTIRYSGRYPGRRRYQIEDHLGNVRAVVSDNKLADTTGGGLFLSAHVLSAKEYYPFGMASRSVTTSIPWANGQYRWGYNGKELDRALGSADAYDYGFRAYRAEIALYVSGMIFKKAPEISATFTGGFTHLQ
jgi:hypothetical protein